MKIKEKIISEIKKKEKIDVSQFMQLCLYGDDGYYINIVSKAFEIEGVNLQSFGGYAIYTILKNQDIYRIIKSDIDAIEPYIFNLMKDEFFVSCQ